MAISITSNLLDACVLAILNKGDTYGYKLTQEIKEVINISESTLYPVLRRLQKDDCLQIYDEAVLGRNRRYYRITEKGGQVLRDTLVEWDEYVDQVNELLRGGNQS